MNDLSTLPQAGTLTPVDHSELNRLVSGLGFEIVDIAGFLESVNASSEAQLHTLQDAQGGVRSITDSSAMVVASAARVATSTQEALATVEHSFETVRAVSEKSQSVSVWVADFEGRITDIAQTLGDVKNANDTINAIATQVNILAINARIEAARAGDAGRGFAVVATAINELSKSTSVAVKNISDQVKALTSTVDDMRQEAQVIARDAQHVLAQSSDTNTALQKISTSVAQASSDTREIAEQSQQVDQATQIFAPAFENMAALTRQTADGVTQATKRTTALIDRSEAIVQRASALGGQTADTPFITYVQEAAKHVSALWDQAIDAQLITMDALFDRDYVPVPGTNPQQFTTRFTSFADQTLPQVQEAALNFDPSVVFCAAVDHAGYLPTHNKKFAQPQSDDPVWNASNCRNRRIFDDRVGLKSGNNTEPFLLQVYRRDMGGGAFAMMKDLSAPIVVKGRHWGGLRMAYTVS